MKQHSKAINDNETNSNSEMIKEFQENIISMSILIQLMHLLLKK